MGILLFNYVGLIATVVVMAPLLWSIIRLEAMGWTSPQAMALFFTGGTTVLAIFGLLWDRRERGDFFRSYWANYRQVIYESVGSIPPTFAYDERRRTAMFLVPLAVSPFCVFVGYSVYLAKAAWQGEDTTWGWYAGVSLGSCALIVVLAEILSRVRPQSLISNRR